MKKLFILLSIIIIGLTACKKDNYSPINGTPIVINGQTYTTVKIGTQTWTSVNYNGTGGVNYNNSANDPRLGKLYSYPELRSLDNLPSGWRIPSIADTKIMMNYLGATNGEYQSGQAPRLILNSESCKKIIIPDGWNNLTNDNNNKIGLNLYPTGHYNPYLPGFDGKGTDTSFWLSDKFTINGSYFEVNGSSSYNSLTLKGEIFTTALAYDNASDKRTIRFVKDN
ncbi:hypothetical protein A5893_16405 [Pedobacter psychrophilus]|uniref:Fibrobacter succinogenes major paralogous domain-containing protein n=1 Tax=Pedobacter psychrophilus TaxID=1826909 RepID=A0A179DA81_9SPHI|nr:FISUMP domain-containing protein [Pedobacter psychrophilus]OAQ37951.1 hypothetical protein A5893_16405 [Pedobacter psychrophilus]